MVASSVLGVVRYNLYVTLAHPTKVAFKQEVQE
jgi:hypothetical protein